MNKVILKCKDIYKSYNQNSFTCQVLNGIDFSLHTAELVVILGQSGSGKSTFLHLLGGLEVPSKGNILYEGQDINLLNDNEKSKWRNKNLGFVYQMHHLLSDFTALENVMMPYLISGLRRSQARNIAKEVLEQVGLKDRLDHYPAQLSGGERQRASIARALVHRPSIVLADEPTGNLDIKNAINVWSLFKNLQSENKVACVVVTHDETLAKNADRVLLMKEGKLNACK